VSHSIICTRQACETEEQPGQLSSGASDGRVASDGSECVWVCVWVWDGEQCRRACKYIYLQPCPRWLIPSDLLLCHPDHSNEHRRRNRRHPSSHVPSAVLRVFYSYHPVVRQRCHRRKHYYCSTYLLSNTRRLHQHKHHLVTEHHRGTTSTPVPRNSRISVRTAVDERLLSTSLRCSQSHPSPQTEICPPGRRVLG
jgi:hypothetical protein